MRFAILFLALLLQVAAAVLAVRMIRVTGHLKAWLFLSSALAMMALRRLISFARAEWNTTGMDLLNDGLGLGVSAAVFLGIWRIKGYFEAAQAREQRLAESEATAKALLDNAADAVEILDESGRYLDVNRAACEGLGYRREDLLGHSPAVLDPRMTEPAIRASIEEVLAGNGKVFETVHRTRSGTEFPVEVHSTPVTYAGRRAVMSIARDISARRRHEEIQRNARKAEGLVQMAGGVAHDFNNLFQVVLANLELARNASDPGSKVAAHIDRARSALDRAGSLAQRIQQFSGGVLRVLEPCDLSGLVETLREGPEEPAGISWELDRELPRVELDPSQVRLVAEAVLCNAREAGGPVRVRTYRRTLTSADLAVGTWAGEPVEGECLVLDVEDRGPGIGPEGLMRLYDPFYSTKGLGRGLGLPAALGLVKGHGGSIQVVSAVGLGTAVRIHFPVEPPAKATGPAAP